MYECTECDFSSKTRSVLVTHLSVHSTIKPYVCTDCGATFKYKQSLHRHIPRHTGNLPFRCPHCNLGFVRKEHLLRHIESHSDDGAHECEHCHCKFKHSISLKRHMNTHTDPNYVPKVHNRNSFKNKTNHPTVPQMLNCPHCSQVFLSRARFKKHLLKTHLTCPEPDSNVLDSSALKQEEDDTLPTAGLNLDIDCSDMDVASSTPRLSNDQDANAIDFSAEIPEQLYQIALPALGGWQRNYSLLMQSRFRDPLLLQQDDRLVI